MTDLAGDESGRPGPYIYEPLTKETCTRILTFRPPQDDDDILSFDVNEVDLDGVYAPFVALSQ